MLNRLKREETPRGRNSWGFVLDVYTSSYHFQLLQLQHMQIAISSIPFFHQVIRCSLEHCPGCRKNPQLHFMQPYHCFPATSTPGSTSWGTYLDSKLHPAAFLFSIPGFGFLQPFSGRKESQSLYFGARQIIFSGNLEKVSGADPAVVPDT